jgi:hypothetical protein
MKPSVFIGSSSEALPIAQLVEKELSKHFDAKLWKDHLFELGEDTLNSLLIFMQCYDFAVLVVTDDDTSVVRKKRSGTPRDNVIYELGLFTGSLGRRRTFAVVSEKSVKPNAKKKASPKIPTDILGTNTARISDMPIAKLKRHIHKDLKDLVETIQERSEQATLQLLPSTGLATGYVQNFVLPVCRGLADLKTIQLNGNSVDVSKGNFDFTIVLPKNLTKASVEGAKAYVQSKGLHSFSLKLGNRDYPFYVGAKVVKGKVHFYDYPTTLGASHKAVQMALSGPYVGFSKYHAILDQKEIANFKRAIDALLTEPGASGVRDMVKIIQAN